MTQSSNKKKEGERATKLELALRAASSAMGCFFGCFRVKDSHPVSPPEPVVHRSNNALSSLFLCDEEDSPGKAENSGNFVAEEIDFRELETEAKFLKACGTIAKTPIEIRKASDKWKGVAAQNGKESSLKQKISFSNESKVKSDPRKLPDDNPIPITKCEEWVVDTCSLEASPSSCLTQGHDTRCSISSIQSAISPTHIYNSDANSTISSASPVVLPPIIEGKNKSVCFNCEFDGSDFSSKSSPEGASPCSKQCESVSESKEAFHSTPLKSTDEIQSPGIGILSKCVDNEATMTPIMMTCTGSRTNPVEENKEASLSYWLKASASRNVNNENRLYGKTPGDRPILGMVAAHWKYEETPRITSVIWDGNGIPNSTNKYKEDQKVSWHATPFEERLEKALSEGTFPSSQRNTISGPKPVEFGESEESDTALSRLKSSNQIKPVVSFC